MSSFPLGHAHGKPASCTVDGIPLIDITVVPKTTVAYTHLVEVVSGLKEKPVLDDAIENVIPELTPSLAFKDPIRSIGDIQYVLLQDMSEGGDRTWTLVKHITNKFRVTTKIMKNLCSGKLYALDTKKLANTPRHVPVVLQNLLEKLGGDSILNGSEGHPPQGKEGSACDR
eukprot:536106-Amphidinium_carterae.1